MKKITRKRFLMGMALLAALAATGLSLLGLRSYEELIARILRDLLKPDRAEPEGLRKFAALYAQRHPVGGIKLRILEISFRLPSGLLPGKLINRQEELRSDLHGSFLLSSDYFITADGAPAPGSPGRLLNFVAYYDPHRRLCSNPFARFVEER